MKYVCIFSSFFIPSSPQDVNIKSIQFSPISHPQDDSPSQFVQTLFHVGPFRKNKDMFLPTLPTCPNGELGLDVCGRMYGPVVNDLWVVHNMVVVVMSPLRLLVIRFVVVVDLVTRWRGIRGRGVVAHPRDPLLTVHVEGDRREVNTQRVMVP